MLLELFSKRRRRERGEITDVFTYDELPAPLRVQIVHVVSDGLDTNDGPDEQAEGAYKFIHDTLAREYGLFYLTDAAKARYPDFRKAVLDFFLRTDDIERALDVVELAARYIERVVPDWRYAAARQAGAESVIEELNERFKEAAVGYQYESGAIMRIDSQLLHQEAVKPALYLIAQPEYEGANDEFLRAHEHYRHGRHKEAVNEALKAFESTMKVICSKRGWQVDANATASRLLDTCFSNGLLPAPLQAHFGGVRATLESGIPTVRNKLAGHGQGSRAIAVPQYLVGYALNVTASAIRLLCEAESSGQVAGS
jgi:hypothetical protein